MDHIEAVETPGAILAAVPGAQAAKVRYHSGLFVRVDGLSARKLRAILAAAGVATSATNPHWTAQGWVWAFES